jgi:sulfur carrier protein
MKEIELVLQETATDRIEVHLNGKPTALPAGTTIETFLLDRSLHDRMVVVEVNGQIVPRTAFATTTFRNGDEVEVVHFVGGG